MKKLLLLLLLTLNITTYSQCSVYGTAKNLKDSLSNKLKNREVVQPKKASPFITLDKMLKPGEDSKRFLNTDYAIITGYITEVKFSGPESCNCGSDVIIEQDVHIYVGPTDTSSKANCIVIEITPRFRRANPEFNVKSFKGKKVKIGGYMFYDEEHKGNAINTCKKCGNIWRRTAWEIHPVVSLELAK